MSVNDNDALVPRRKPGIVFQMDMAFGGYSSAAEALADVTFEWEDSEETAAMISDQGRLFELNLVGLLIWDSIDGQRSLEQIRSEVISLFDVDSADALNDLEEVMEQLTRFGLVLVEDGETKSAAQ